MEWEVYARKTEYVIAQFLLETNARDYARERNQGRRNWCVRKIGDNNANP